MRSAEYAQIGTRTETHTVFFDDEYDENGCITVPAHEEEVTVEVPVMGMVYRDMTPDEEAEAEASFTPIEKTDSERIAELEAALEALLRGETE